MVITYDAEIRPCLDSFDQRMVRDSIGLSCPVCHASALTIRDVQEHLDGSATGRCVNCHALLRQNPEGFVFLDGQ